MPCTVNIENDRCQTNIGLPVQASDRDHGYFERSFYPPVQAANNSHLLELSNNSRNHTYSDMIYPASDEFNNSSLRFNHTPNRFDNVSNSTVLRANRPDNMSNGLQLLSSGFDHNETDCALTERDQTASEPCKYELEAHYRQQAEQQHERKRVLMFTKEEESNHPSASSSSSRTTQVYTPQTHQRRSQTRYRAYKSEDTRIKSFVGFQSACSRSPENFAACGFFYKGFSDIVACFQCGFTYKNWHVNDDPFFIHKTFQSECEFINQLHLDGVNSSADLVENYEKDVEMKEVTCETEKLSISK